MVKRLLALAVTVVAGVACIALARANFQVHAQNRVAAADSGHVALGLALRKLAVSGTFLQIAAHPDDEHNALFAMFTHGMGLRSIDLQTTRGEGGQNEIGPELFRDMGVLRTSELLAAHRLDGAEQYFTRAIDYGYSFDPQEVIEQVGPQGNRRRFRPPDPHPSSRRGADHEHPGRAAATARMKPLRFFRARLTCAAGDPAKYPEQIKQGLRPWQPRKLYFTAGFGGGRGGPAGRAGPPPCPRRGRRS